MHLKSLFHFFILFLLASCSYLPELTLDDTNIQSKLTETSDRIVLQPTSGSASSALIFYPGGLVDPHVYLGWQDKLVTETPGLMIITVKMPANLAVLGINSGLKVMEDYPEIENWYVGGHSLGGTMGAELISGSQDKFKALILIASYPANDGLKNWTGAVLSVHASNDGLSTPTDIEAHKAELPNAIVMTDMTGFSLPLQSKSHYYEILGGNHGQFGNYGVQENDSVATITREAQQTQLVTVIKNFISAL